VRAWEFVPARDLFWLEGNLGNSIRSLLSGVFAVVATLIGVGAFGAGTAANTAITNTAQVTYTLSGSPLTLSSNTTVLNVAEILNVNVAVQTPSSSVAAGATQRVIVVRITNTGNGSETFEFTGDSAIAGADFNPIPSAPFLYFDVDSSNDLSAADVAYSPGTNDPTLAADQFINVLIVNNIPAALANGAIGRTQLTARARTGSGAPGTVYAGQGAGGVDAVIGMSGATQFGTGAYVVGGLQLSAVKSQAIADQFGGTRAVAGARINYQIVVTPTGSGIANAVTFTDVIPANTTFLAGTLRLNGVALTDGVDADAGQFDTAPATQVRVSLGNLTTASGAQTIDFAVHIN
jgi:uncharacterized repeat protein (TIGR01451 family)